MTGGIMKKNRRKNWHHVLNSIGTQDELADFLRKAGYPVTQATVSRDIKNGTDKGYRAGQKIEICCGFSWNHGVWGKNMYAC